MAFKIVNKKWLSLPEVVVSGVVVVSVGVVTDVVDSVVTAHNRKKTYISGVKYLYCFSE